MTTPIALSDVLSGTGQGIVLGIGPDGAPVILAWRPQILGVQAPPVALTGFLQAVLAHALRWPDGRACAVVAVLPAVLLAAIADHPRLEVVDGAAPTFAADLAERLEATLAAGAVLGLTVPADGSPAFAARGRHPHPPRHPRDGRSRTAGRSPAAGRGPA